MNSFTVTAVGTLLSDPKVGQTGDASFTTFCLVGTDYIGSQEHGTARKHVTRVSFVAFGRDGELLARDARKGDQLFVKARLSSKNSTESSESGCEYSLVVQGFRFGAPGRG